MLQNKNKAKNKNKNRNKDTGPAATYLFLYTHKPKCFLFTFSWEAKVLELSCRLSGVCSAVTNCVNATLSCWETGGSGGLRGHSTFSTVFPLFSCDSAGGLMQLIIAASI